MKYKTLGLLIAVMIFGFSCTPEKEASPAEEPVAEEEKTSSEAPEQGTLTLSSPGEADVAGDSGDVVVSEGILPSQEGGELSSEDQRSSGPIPLGAQERLAFRSLSAYLLPEDPLLGPLGGGGDDEAVFVPLRQFFDSLGERNVSREILLPELVDYLDRQLSTFPEGFLRYRLGTVSFLGLGRASVNCRLFLTLNNSEFGTVTGEVFLDNREGSWMISAVDIDFSVLEEPYQGPSESFEPQTYRWLELY